MKKHHKGRGGKGGRVDKEIEAVERFRVNVQFAIQRLMMEQGVSQTALAKRLGMSQPRVSQFFSPKCNLTIRNLARVFHALDDRCFVWSAGLQHLAEQGKVPAPPIFMPRLRVCASDPSYEGWTKALKRVDLSVESSAVETEDAFFTATPGSGLVRATFEVPPPDSKRPSVRESLVS